MEPEKQVSLNDIIKEKKSLPKEIKQKIVNNIFFNCLIYILMLILTLIVIISFYKFSIRTFETYIDIIQIACCLISVAVLETAYRKDSGILGIYGIEVLLFSISVLFVPYSYITKSNTDLLKNVILVFAVYYFLKMFIMSIHTRNKYIRENMSDVKEIVKEEKESYIDEESTKTLKKQKIEAEKRKKAKEEKVKKAKTQKVSGGNKK